jgi:DNA-binding transcriptional ArsR family regulator
MPKRPPARLNGMPWPDAENLAAALWTLASASRLRLLSLLCTVPGSIAADLIEEMDLEQNTVAVHLRRMRAVNVVVASEQVGTRVPLYPNFAELEWVAAKVRELAR